MPSKDVITFGKGYADLQQDVVKPDGLCDVMIDVYIKNPNEIPIRMADTTIVTSSNIKDSDSHVHLPLNVWQWTSKHKYSDNDTYMHIIGSFTYNGGWYFGIVKAVTTMSVTAYTFVEIVNAESLPLMTNSLAAAQGLRAFLSVDRIIFCNGVDKNWYVKINKYNEIETGILGAEYPTGLLNVDEIITTDIIDDEGVDVVTSGSSGVTIEAGSLLAMCYTIEMKDGTESNPSPISVCSKLQFQNYDITGLVDVGFSKYAKTIKISGITVPSAIIEDNIKYINIYMQDFPYTEVAGINGTFKLVKKAFYVKDMETAAINEPYTLQDISYDNNTSAISKDIISVNGTTFQANNTIKTVFPNDKIQYFTRLDIDNVNSQTFVNQAFRIKLDTSFITKENGGTFLSGVSNFAEFMAAYETDTPETGNSKYQNFAQHICFYDQDMITPLPFAVVYYNAGASTSVQDYLLEYNSTSDSVASLIVYVNIPIVYENITHSIYFCYSQAGDSHKLISGADYTGDPERNRNGGVLWLNVADTSAYNYTIPKYGIRSSRNITAFGFDKLDTTITTDVMNDRIVTLPNWSRAYSDNTIDDVIDTGLQTIYWSAFYNQLPFQNESVLKKLVAGEIRVKLCSALNGDPDDDTYKGDAGGFNNYDSEQNTYYGYFRIDQPVVPSPVGDYFYEIATIFSQRSSWGIFIGIRGDEPTVIRMLAINDTQTLQGITSELLKLTINTDSGKGDTYCFYAISYDNVANKLTLFLSELHQNPTGTGGSKTKFTYFTSVDGSQLEEDITYGSISPSFESIGIHPNIIVQNAIFVTTGSVDWHITKAMADYTQVHNIPLYLNTKQDFINLMFHLPHFDTGFIGSVPYYLLGDDANGNPYPFDLNRPEQNNQNIAVNYTKQIIDEEKQSDSLSWSKQYQDGFPALNFKKFDEDVIRIIQSPSFLPFQYQNTILIFTNKTVYRFVLNSNTNEWASADNVIPELRGYGLMAKNSIAVSGQYVYWLSESGLIRWGADGINNITKDKVDIKNLVVVNSSLSNDLYYGIYCPEKKQYWLFRTSDGINDGLLLGGDSYPPSGSPSAKHHSYAFIYHEDYDAFTRYEFAVTDYIFEYIKSNKQGVAGITNGTSNIAGMADGTTATGNYGVIQHTTKKHSANFLDFELSNYSKNFGTESPEYLDPNITITGSSASATKTYTNTTERLKFNVPYGFNGETFKMTLKNISLLKYIILTYNQKSSSLS